MPLITSPTYLHRFARQAGESVAPGALVLDAGAGDSPYRQYFQHATYEATDHCKRDAHTYSHVSYVCDLTSIPVEGDRYDLVLCTQVLEHVPRPREVLRELHRVLKPGAKLWISAPLFFEEHEIPHDFFRYTQFAWRHMLDEAGFQVERLEWVSGYYGTLSHQLNMARRALPSSPRHYGGGMVGALAAGTSLLVKPLMLALSWFYSKMDLRHRFTQAGCAMDYCVVARKIARDSNSARGAA